MKLTVMASLLSLLMTGAAGCGPSNTDGSQVKVAESAYSSPELIPQQDPVPVTPQETAAMAALEERSAKIDLNDDGHVRIVEFSDAQATNDDLKLLADCAELEALEIIGGSVDDEGLEYLRGLTRLQRLYLHDLKVTNKGLAKLTGLVALEVLSLKNTKMDGDGLPQLKGLTRLEVLNLAGNDITSKALRKLPTWKFLETLVLADTHVTGDGLKYLKPLSKLRVLNVDRCDISDPDLLLLIGFDDLRMLYVHECDLSEEKIEELGKQMPRLAVFRH